MKTQLIKALAIVALIGSMAWSAPACADDTTGTDSPGTANVCPNGNVPRGDCDGTGPKGKGNGNGVCDGTGPKGNGNGVCDGSGPKGKAHRRGGNGACDGTGPQRGK